MVHTGYNPSLVALSIAIAVLASYTALDLGGRVRGASAGARWGWVCSASLAMGGGIWAMHFVGMLAFEMAMPVLYDVRLTALSFVIAVAATGTAFAWVSRPGARPRDFLVSGPLMGIGVAAMHYAGMAAMVMPGNLAYDAPVVAASVLIAVSAATVALWLTTRQNDVWQKAAAAGVMGIAVAGMHYTGMAAATFTEEAHGAAMAHPSGVGLGQANVALYVAGATFLVLFLGMFASALDQQRVGRALHASEERFRAAAEAVGDIIWTTDAAGDMRAPQADWQRFTGQSAAEYEGRGWTSAIHLEDLAPTMGAWRSSVAARRPFSVEHRIRRQDGVYRICSVRAVPVMAHGSVREWVGVHEDVTERREAEQAVQEARDAAEEANLAKSTFIANMSHELRTPLSAIIGYSEMLLEQAEDGIDAVEFAPDMRRIESNARHLLGLINDVLDLSKIESGKMEVFAEIFDVERMLDEVASSVAALVGKKGNRLVLELRPGLGSAHTDAVKIRQILLNLLSNAAKFTERGTIILSADREPGRAGEPDRLVFSVSDTGIGMTEGQIAQLFQRFHQADPSTTRRYGGTGLGLALSAAFGTMVGGAIDVASKPGEGSRFTLRMPASCPRPAAMPPGSSDEAVASATA